MFPKLIFIDIKPELVSQVQYLLESNPTIKIGEAETLNISEHLNYECVVGDITDYVNRKNTAFTSAANGEGMLLGGVDNALDNMFPMVQYIINETIAKIKYVNKHNQYFIPVGSATIVPVCNHEENVVNDNQYLITAPTMLSPSNVKNTNNCYHALYAVLRVVQKYNAYLKENKLPEIDTILCPGMGTGVGGITSEDAAKQFYQAVYDFITIDLTGKIKPDDIEMYTDVGKFPDAFIKAPIKMITMQPKWFTFVKYRNKNQS